MPAVPPTPAEPIPLEPTPAEYAEHRRAARAAGAEPPFAEVLVPALRTAAFAGGGVYAGGLVLGFVAAITGLADGALIRPAFLAGLATFVIVLVVRFRVVRDGMLDRRLRLHRVAVAHGFAYAPGGAVRLPGLIFQQGGQRVVSEHIRSLDGREVEAGNYRYTTGSGKNRTTHFWSYVAVRLDSPLPHMVLDATANDAWGTNLPAAIAGAQRLQLEGDFDRTFRLFVPDGYETDALYVFTPDLMARLIDHAAQDDLEVVDDWLLAYRQGAADLAHPSFWWRLQEITTVVADRLADRGSRYRDDRVAGNLRPAAAHLAGVAAPAAAIAEPGRRLRTTVPWRTFIIVAIVAAAFLWMWGTTLFTTVG